MSEQLNDKWMRSETQMNEKSDEMESKDIESKGFNKLILIDIKTKLY